MRELAPILRAAALAAFVVGTLLFLLNPPSLSGAGGLLTLAAVATATVLLGAWATVALAGRRSLTEEEFERVVRRTEELGRSDAPVSEPDDFDDLVAEAIDRLPPVFRHELERVPVVVSDRGAEARAYGQYFGDTAARGRYEDRIVLYRDTLERDFGHDDDLLRAQVERTLRHELAHHLGWDETGVGGLGL